MKKGFTLIEIIGALAILSLLALLAVPAIQNGINHSNDTVYEAQIDLIIEASKNWVADHIERLPKKDKDKVGVTLLELKKGGYIDKEIKNPKTGNPFSDDLLVVITKENEYFRYEVKEESDLAPTLLLIGSENVYLNYGQSYQEPGVSAKKNNGEEIEEVTIVIKKNDEVVEEVDPTQYGIYTITYQVSDNGTVVTVKRNVHIIDNEPPVILFEEDPLLLDINTTSFDAMDGVTIEDNSGENVKIEVTGNVSLGIPGTYELTYTAIDSSGNFIKKTRTIEIAVRLCKKNNESSNLSYGDSFTCELGDGVSRTFYLLEESKDQITLLLDRNLGGLTSFTNASSVLKSQTAGWTKLTQDQVNLPSAAQIEQAGNVTSTTDSLGYRKILSGSSWLCPNLSASNTAALPYAYWTDTPIVVNGNANYHVYYGCGMGADDITCTAHSGVRPTITISKSNIW